MLYTMEDLKQLIHFCESFGGRFVVYGETIKIAVPGTTEEVALLKERSTWIAKFMGLSGTGSGPLVALQMLFESLQSKITATSDRKEWVGILFRKNRKQFLNLLGEGYMRGGGKGSSPL